VQTELLKSQDKIVKEIIKKLKDKIVDKKIEKVLLVQKADDTSGGITTTIKYIKPGYNKALFITWDISPTSKEDYIYRIEITEKYQQARPEIRLDKYYIDKDEKGNYPISNEISLFIELN
jgi:hypothetical protein